jgi:hypothetical protein
MRLRGRLAVRRQASFTAQTTRDDPRLRTRRLKGELSAERACAVNREDRALCRFPGSIEAIYDDAGTREIHR